MFDNPSNFYFWCVSGIAVLVGFDTILRLITERHRLQKDDLNENDRAMLWRAVVFLIFPLFTLMELKSAIIGTESFGGEAASATYGLLWYELIPGQLSQDLIIPALFSGEFVILFLALSFLPALLFRPHPALATLIGYTVAFIFSVSLIVEPVASLLFGFEDSKWALAMKMGAAEQLIPLMVIHAVAALFFLAIIQNKQVRLWFSELSRPNVSDRLKAAIFEYPKESNTARSIAKIGLLYQQSGLSGQAWEQLKVLEKEYQGSIYAYFLKALLQYNSRDFKGAKSSFLYASDLPGLTTKVKANLLAAGACSAFAKGEVIQAINLSDRSLEYDSDYAVARMVKVDALLKLGRKDQAANEILKAVHSSLTMDLDNKVPLDIEETFPLLEVDQSLVKQDSKMFEAISKN